MRVRAEIDGSSLTTGLKFYGQEGLDRETIHRLNEIRNLLQFVKADIDSLEGDVKERDEKSARMIQHAIKDIREMWKEDN